jgi:hypothetical protein
VWSASNSRGCRTATEAPRAQGPSDCRFEPPGNPASVAAWGGGLLPTLERRLSHMARLHERPRRVLIVRSEGLAEIRLLAGRLDLLRCPRGSRS